jgi:hypothetical protein
MSSKDRVCRHCQKPFKVKRPSEKGFHAYPVITHDR